MCAGDDLIRLLQIGYCKQRRHQIEDQIVIHHLIPKLPECIINDLTVIECKRILQKRSVLIAQMQGLFCIRKRDLFAAVRLCGKFEIEPFCFCGIGAGSGCDAQVLVCQDLLGMFGDFVPKFVKQYAQIGEQMTAAFRAYDQEVKAGTFPAPEQSFVKSDSSDEFLAQLDSEY